MTDKDEIIVLKAIVIKQEEKISCLKQQVKLYQDTLDHYEVVLDNLIKKVKK